MNVDELRPALATPFPAVVLEIAHQFLLLRVDRYGRFVRRKERRGLRVDVLKLRVAIDVLAAFSSLVVRLQAVAHAAQKVADNRRANRTKTQTWDPLMKRLVFCLSYQWRFRR